MMNTSQTATRDRILLVEDDANFGAVLRDYLELYDYEVILAKDGQEGLQAFRGEDPQLCILDVMMPRKDGFTLASEIRKVDPALPLIFLTAKTLREDVLRGYQVGADDYLTKPFDSEVLLYKVKAILNRQAQVKAGDDQREFRIGQYRYDSDARELHWSDGTYRLSPKEGALLRLLAVHKNQLVPRSDALRKIWKDENYFTGRSMDVYVAKLRKHLRHDAQVAIVNVHSEGFRLVDELDQ